MRDEFCLRGDEARREPILYRSCGLDGIYLLNGYTVEERDGEEFMAVTELEQLHQAIGLHLVRHRKGLAPREIRFLRNVMDCSQAELAERLGTTAQSVARWEKGKCEVPGASEKLLRLVYLAHFMSEDELVALRNFINSALDDLDMLDETKPAQASFQLCEGWAEAELECVAA